MKEKVTRFVNSRYGIDDLGKTIFFISLAVYVLGVLLQNSILALAAMIGFLVFFCRVLSGEHIDRREENRKFLSYIKLWKLRYENRSTARVYMCPRCGRFVRVPKGKGKIQITCPGCGNKIIKNT
jgi:DNA-directed RNA polymerase subunit RPC12/RpoP